MKRLILAGLFVAALAMPALAVETISFTAAQMGTEIDDATGDPIDRDVVTDPTGRTITGLGTFLDHERMNDYTRNLGVVTFNTSSTSGEYRPNKIVQYYNATARVEFEVVEGLGCYETGYNYGGYESGGRNAISGSNAKNMIGTMPGSATGNTGLATNIICFDVDLVGESTGQYVKYIGGVFIGKTEAVFNEPTLNVTYENMTTEVQQTASMKYLGWAYGDNNALFYGYSAPTGCEIVRASWDCVAANYGAFDDLTFGIAPEPGTMVLLGLGGLGLLIRRKRS